MNRKWIKLAGFVCTVLALCLALWLRPDGEYVGTDTSEGIRAQLTKTRPRERDGMERRTKNPREEFEAARNRGLTEEEVRVIVAEHIDAISYQDKLAQPLEAVLRDIWENRLDIYSDALVDGFHLSQEQIWTLKSKLPALATY